MIGMGGYFSLKCVLLFCGAEVGGMTGEIYHPANKVTADWLRTKGDTFLSTVATHVGTYETNVNFYLRKHGEKGLSGMLKDVCRENGIGYRCASVKPEYCKALYDAYRKSNGGEAGRIRKMLAKNDGKNAGSRQSGRSVLPNIISISRDPRYKVSF